MITWLFDHRTDYGYIPNLVKDLSLRPKTNAWHDLCIQKPYSYEFRLLKYCDLDKVQYNCALVSEDWSGPAYYPINLNFYDPEIDYFSLMEPESLAKLKAGKFRVLFYYSEGDDPKIDIVPSLIKLCRRHGLTFNDIRFVLSNWLIHDKPPFIYFPDDELYYRYLHSYNSNFVRDINLAPRSKKTTCLIRADKLWRRVFGSIFVDLGLHTDSYFSYTGYKYETSSIDEEKLSDWEAIDDELLITLCRFELGIPYKADANTDQEHNNHKLIDRKFFNDSYWNIVVETHFRQNTIFLTEKTFKPILNLQPFCIVGNPGSLRLLKHLGYKTFGNIINEEYDEIDDPEARMKEMLEIAYSIHNRNHLELQNITAAIVDVLKHNQENFLRPKTSRIQNLLNQLEY